MWLRCMGAAASCFGAANTLRCFKVFRNEGEEALSPFQVFPFLVPVQACIAIILLCYQGIPFPGMGAIPMLSLIGCVYVIYLVPYFCALKISNITVVGPLFPLSIAFSTLLGFLLLEEVPGIPDILGCILMAAGIVFICKGNNVDGKNGKGFRWNVLLLMIANTIISSLHVCLIRAVKQDFDIPSVEIFVWSRLAGSVPLFFLSSLIPQVRRHFSKVLDLALGRKVFIAVNEGINGTGIVFMIAGIAAAPLAALASATLLSFLQITIFSFTLLVAFFSPWFRKGRTDHLGRKFIGVALILGGVWAILEL